jgi:uncharacterized protein
MTTIVGPTIKLYSGNYFNFLEPEKSAFTIEDIAHALSNICRFTGHVNDFYSVAQHSVLVSHLVPYKYALLGLLHDAAEAFLGDVSTPLKRLLPEYKVIEHRVEKAVLSHFELYEVLPPCIKQADLVALKTEKRDLMKCTDSWGILEDVEADTNVITPLLPLEAEHLFMKRYREITDRPFGRYYEDDHRR